MYTTSITVFSSISFTFTNDNVIILCVVLLVCVRRFSKSVTLTSQYSIVISLISQVMIQLFKISFTFCFVRITF